MTDGKANVALLKGAYESFGTEGPRAFERVLAAEVEWLESPRMMVPVRYRRERMVARMEQLGWQDWRLEPLDFVDLGDRVVVPLREVHRDPPPHVRPERRRAHLWRFGAVGADRMEVHLRQANAVNAAVGYFALLERIFAHLRPRTYAEIGVHAGRSLGRVPAATRSIGIDPEPIVADPGVEKASKIFRLTSDDFFERHDLRDELGGLPLDMAFIDGMHLFEFALRDFINLERYSTPNSIILVHDVYPAKRVHAQRERETEAWSGDVWKLIPCLREQRPELRVAAIDIRPAGMGIITGLDPESTVLSDSYDEIEARYRALDFNSVEEDKAARLARIDHDWAVIEPLLPPPFDASPEPVRGSAA